jgi:hypothetical protein
LRVVPYAQPFNYAAQCNLGVHEARGELIALVNNDIEVVTPQWLEELVGLAVRPDVGLVGATLFAYPDGTLQHAGVVLGLNGVRRPALDRHATRLRGTYTRARRARRK